jgi:hypothetical protein
MASDEWLAIEARVPGPDEAVRYQAGPSNLGGRPRLLDSIATVLAEEPRASAWLVAPSRRVGRQWLDALALGGAPVFNLRATTPRALCYDLAAPALAASGRRVASPRAALVLLEKVLVASDQASRLASFARPRSYRRLAERMFTSLAAIRMAGLTAADIRSRRGFGDTPKGRDLAVLLEAYASELAAARLVDAADVVAVAVEVVASGRVPADFRRILVPEGTDLVPLERRLIAALGERVHTLPVDP